MSDDIERARAEFVNKFAALPSPLSNEIVVVIDGKPFTWRSAYLEISQKTKTGDEILKVLKGLKII